MGIACAACAQQNGTEEEIYTHKGEFLDERYNTGIGNIATESSGSRSQLQWLNFLIAHTWPQLGQLASHFVEEKVEPILRNQLSGNVQLRKFDLGERPPTVNRLDVYDLPFGTSCVHVKLDYTSDLEVQWDVRSFGFGIKNFSIVGELVFMLRPYIEEHPGTGGITVFFANMPSVNFRFTGVARIAEFKGIKSKIKSVLEQAIADKIVLPNTITQMMRYSDFSLYPMVMGDPDPIGLLRIQTLAAKDMPSGDISCFGLLGGGVDDNYIRISLGSERWRAKVSKSALGETHDFFIFDPEQRISVELWDEDVYTDDDLLGLAGPYSLSEVTAFSEKPIPFVDPNDKETPAGSVTLKIDYYHGAPYTVSPTMNAVMLPIREVHLPRTKEKSRVFVRAEVGKVQSDSTVGVHMANTEKDQIVSSVMTDVQERLRKRGFAEEEVLKLTATDGLRCNGGQAIMAINHCLMFMIPEGIWDSPTEEIRLSLLEKEESQDKKKKGAATEVLLGKCAIKMDQLKKAERFFLKAQEFKHESGIQYKVEVSAFLCGFQEGEPERIEPGTLRKSRLSRRSRVGCPPRTVRMETF